MTASSPAPKDARPGRALGARKRGYTLVELMIAFSILAILVTVMLPRFGLAIRRANESATQAKLRAVRMALDVYYADAEGAYPSDLTPLLQPGSKYLTQIVPVYTADHGKSNEINYLPEKDDSDTGGWGYLNAGPHAGEIWIQCTHTDLRGTPWSQY